MVHERSPKNGRGLLKDRAYERIREMILKGSVDPGTIMSKRQLARQLRMSKTPVDSALDRLASEGFVSISPRQGVVVSQPSVHDLADLFDIRLALEPFVVGRLAGRLTEAQKARLCESLDAQAAAMGAGDFERAARLDAGYHVMLCEFFNNGEILRVMRHLRGKLDRIILQVFTLHTERLTSNHQEHAAITAANIDGRGAEAAENMERHLTVGRSYLVAS